MGELLHCFDDIIALQNKINNIQEQLKHDPNNTILLNEYGRLENMLLHKNGYNYEYQIDLMISKFGFDKSCYDRKITTFSGGERSKIAFAKLLLNEPNFWKLGSNKKLKIFNLRFTKNYLKLLNYLYHLITNYEQLVL